MFRVSPQDIRQFLAMTLGGGVLFAGLALGNLYTKKKLAEPEFTKGEHGAKAIQTDATLLSVLTEIEEKLDKSNATYVSFLRNVHLVDRVLQDYRNFLTERNAQPQTSSTKQRWRDIFCDNETTLKTQHLLFVTRFGESKEADEKFQMEQLLQRVESRVRQYVQNVWNYTS